MMSRYHRHELLDMIGPSGQKKIADAHVVIIGCGGLGTVAAAYLAGAGIGKITLIDGDKPDITNLHRQVFYDVGSDLGKSEQLKNYLLKFNPEISIQAHQQFISKKNIGQLLNDPELVLECTDEMMVKYMVNDFCNLHRIPMVYGSLHKYDGYISLFKNESDGDIHLRDIFPDPDRDLPSCSEVGVLNTIAGMIGILQANEAIKWLAGLNENLVDQLLIYNIIKNEQTRLKLKKTWKESIKSTWDQNKYTMAYHCDIPEIEVDQLLTSPDQYQIISILNGKNHEPITDHTEHIQASEFNVYEWEPEDERPTVIYCTSGKVSLQLALQLKEEHPDHEILSLKGGIKAVKKYRQSIKDEH